MVTLKIGPEQHIFTIRRDLLCHHSRHFYTLFNGNFEDSRTGVSIIVDLDVCLVKIFVTWLNTGHVSYPRESEHEPSLAEIFCGDDDRPDIEDDKTERLEVSIRRPPLKDDELHTWSWYTIVRLYVFGDRFLIPELQNCAIDAMKARAELTLILPGVLAINYAFYNAPKHSPLRQMLIEMELFEYRPLGLAEYMSLHQEFIANVLWSRHPEPICVTCCDAGCFDADREWNAMTVAATPRYIDNLCGYYRDHYEDPYKYRGAGAVPQERT